MEAMGIADIAHKSLVLGLVGITLYYGAYTSAAVPSILTRYQAKKKALEQGLTLEEYQKAQETAAAASKTN